MFSWVPLCHGECGSQNWICAPVAILISAYLAISPTLIPVKRRVQVRRRFPIFALIASLTHDAE